MAKQTNRWLTRIFWMLAIAGVAVSFIWAVWPAAVPVEMARIQRTPYQQVISEEGKTRAREIYTVASPVSGNLKRVTLHAGDWIQQGDIVAELEWDETRPIRSPVTGHVLRIIRESAGPIERGQPILEIADAASLEIVAEVLTVDAVQIQEGAPIRITGWGGDEPLSGEVRLVEPSAFTKVSALGIEEQRVNVVIDFTSPIEKWQRLGNGFRVDCHIIIYQSQATLTVPTGALFRVGDAWHVFQVIAGKARKKPVKIARRNPDLAMVAEGLKEGDLVVVYPNDAIEEGKRVRPLH